MQDKIAGQAKKLDAGGNGLTEKGAEPKAAEARKELDAQLQKKILELTRQAEELDARSNDLKRQDEVIRKETVWTMDRIKKLKSIREVTLPADNDNELLKHLVHQALADIDDARGQSKTNDRRSEQSQSECKNSPSGLKVRISPTCREASQCQIC